MSSPSAHLQQAVSQFPQYHLHRSVISSFEFKNPSYITQFASFPLPSAPSFSLAPSAAFPTQISKEAAVHAQHHLLAAVSSDFIIKLYTLSNAEQSNAQTFVPNELSYFSQLKGHKGAIREVQFFGCNKSFFPQAIQTPGSLLLTSCSEDGTCRVWDVRMNVGDAQITFSHPKRKPFFSCASQGNTLVAGSTEGNMFFWDWRANKLMAKTEEFHTEEINQLAYHPFDNNLLFSAGEDGLICQIRAEGDDQDEWIETVISTEQPVNRFGFFGPKAEYLYSLSSIETMSLWHCADGVRVSDFVNVRGQLTETLQKSHMFKREVEHSQPLQADYLIDCHYEEQSQRLFLAAGSFSGDLILAHVNRNEIQPFCLAHVPLAATIAHDVETEDNNLMPQFKGMEETTQQPALNLNDQKHDVDLNENKDDDVALEDAENIYEDDGAPSNDEFVNKIDPRVAGHTASIRTILWFANNLVTGAQDSRLCLWGNHKMTGDEIAQASASSNLKIKSHSSSNNSHAATPSSLPSSSTPSSSSSSSSSAAPTPLPPFASFNLASGALNLSFTPMANAGSGAAAPTKPHPHQRKDVPGPKRSFRPY